MKQNRKTKSFIPPRPSSGSSFQSQQSNQQNQRIKKYTESEYSAKNLMDELKGAFNTMDIYNNIDNNDFSSSYKSSVRGFNDSYENSLESNHYNNLEQKSRLQKKQLSTISNTPLNGQDILAKAKSLLYDQKANIEEIKLRQKKSSKYKTKVPKDGAFLTGINVYKEEEIDNEIKQEEYKENEDEDKDQEDDTFNVEDYMKELVFEEKQRTEDYSDIWKLIHAAKKECSEYGEELYQLKNITSDTNSQLNTIQRGVKQQVIVDLDQGLERAIPGGVKQNVFRQRQQYENISNSSSSLMVQNKQQRKKLPSMNYNSSQKIIRPQNQSISSSQTEQVKGKRDSFKNNQQKISSKVQKKHSTIDTRDDYI